MTEGNKESKEEMAEAETEEQLLQAAYLLQI